MNLGNRIGLFVFLSLISIHLHAQSALSLYDGEYNLSTFYQQNVDYDSVMAILTSDDMKHHPEYGVNPFRSPCDDCNELLDKRTIYERVYIKKGTEGNTRYFNKSYFPTSFKDENGWLRTIDGRLQPLSSKPNYFAASQQPVTTAIDAGNMRIEMNSRDIHVSSQPVRVYYELSDKTELDIDSVHLGGKYFAGNDGTKHLDVYPNIDMYHIFRIGRIKSYYQINRRLVSPKNANYLVFEERLILSKGTSVEKDFSQGGEMSDDGYWRGGLLLNMPNQAPIAIEKAGLMDASNLRMVATYDYLQVDSIVILKIRVPIWFLNSSSTNYPFIVDPTLVGYNKMGNFESSLSPGSFSFTYEPLGTCDYHLSVTVPGMSNIQNTYVDVEFENRISDRCGSPALPAPGCVKRDLYHIFESDECGTNVSLSCNRPISGDTAGLCTTDPLSVPGAAAILIPGFLDCIPAQCPDYELNFTLKNVETQCGDVCGQTCAEGYMWAVTIEARQLEGYILPNKDPVCAGEAVVITAYPSWGVPPYHYNWSTGDTTQVITVHPESSTFYSCTISDDCGIFVIDDTLINVIPSPPADAGTDKYLCEGGAVNLGGSPTGPFGTTFVWSSPSAVALTYMSGTLASNPGVTIPAGTLGEFIYIVKVSNSQCYRYDTVKVYSIANPTPTISTNGDQIICEGSDIDITSDSVYEQYQWSNGGTTRIITVNIAGNYVLSVTDSNGCKGVSNAINISVKPLIQFLADPDTTIDPGDSVNLFANIDLLGGAVDSFYWEPPMYLDCDHCPNPQATPEEEMVYYLHVLSDGCWNTDSLVILIDYPFDFFVPNAFSPNNDGLNDDFYMIGSKVLTVTRFMVFDRWGEKVWDLPQPWTGIYKGVVLNPGVYIYYIEVEFDGTQKSQTGSVTLIR